MDPAPSWDGRFWKRLIKDVPEKASWSSGRGMKGNTLHAILAPKKSAQEREKEKERNPRKGEQERMQKESCSQGEREATGTGGVCCPSPNPTFAT